MAQRESPWPVGRSSGVSGRVLEIGCGIGLPSLVAARGGADVVSTDWAEDAIALLRAQRGGATASSSDARVWDWRGDPAALGGPFDLVLAADVLYEARNHAPLLRVLPGLVAPRPALARRPRPSDRRAIRGRTWGGHDPAHCAR